jgi:glycosyltransferase involved in cell wall biosynthesis
MLFLGAIHELHSPNHDALCWFVDEVLPLVEAELGWRTRLTVAGHLGAGVALDRFAGHPRIILRGEVRDAAPLYERHVAFVAPTRFAAGIPYKVHEAASFGLPVVATELLSRQLGWRDDEELLAAPASDARGFAERVLRLHSSEPVWHRLRTAALDRIAREHAPEGYETALLAILG